MKYETIKEQEKKKDSKNKEKFFYDVLSINKLKKLIQEIKADPKNSKEGKRKGYSSIVLHFKECENHKGQLQRIDDDEYYSIKNGVKE